MILSLKDYGNTERLEVGVTYLYVFRSVDGRVLYNIHIDSANLQVQTTCCFIMKWTSTTLLSYSKNFKLYGVKGQGLNTLIFCFQIRHLFYTLQLKSAHYTFLDVKNNRFSMLFRIFASDIRKIVKTYQKTKSVIDTRHIQSNSRKI